MKTLSALSGRFAAILTVGLLAGPVSASGHHAGKTAENTLAPLERFLGEWEINGRWTSGDELHARNVIDWGIAKKFITAKTFVKNPDGTEYQRYDAVFAFHPKKKCLYQVSFTYKGDINETVIETAGEDTLHIGWKPFDANEPSNVRQIIKFVGKDSYVWTVQVKDGDDWKKLIEGAWTRKK
jgi:hypothetical protein